MGKASEHWTSFDGLKRGSNYCKEVESVLEAVDGDYLCSEALKVRQEVEKLQHPDLTCTIDRSRFASGYHHVVLAIDFSDSMEWAVRIRLLCDDTDEEIETEMLVEVATMRLIRSRTTVPVPEVYSFNVKRINPFGRRYIMMEAIPGRRLERKLSSSVPRASWDHVAEQLADYSHQLSCLTFERIGRVWGGKDGNQEPSIIALPGDDAPRVSSVDYFTGFREAYRQWVEQEHAHDDRWQGSLWIIEQGLQSAVVENFVHGPFPLCHMDFHHGNILFDDEYNIIGIVDWSNAQTAPLERFVISPEFVTFPMLSAEENEPTLTFRDMFASAWKEREIELGIERTANSSRTPYFSDMFGTPSWEIVYRSTYTNPWLALTDAQLILRQMYGSEARLEDFVSYY